MTPRLASSIFLSSLLLIACSSSRPDTGTAHGGQPLRYSDAAAAQHQADQIEKEPGPAHSSPVPADDRVH